MTQQLRNGDDSDDGDATVTMGLKRYNPDVARVGDDGDDGDDEKHTYSKTLETPWGKADTFEEWLEDI